MVTYNYFSKQSGFTLLEMLLVVVILGLSAAYVAPRIGGGESRSLLAQVRQTIAVLNYSRRQAIVTGSPVHVDIELLKNTSHIKIPVDSVAKEARKNSDIIFYSGGASSGAEFEIGGNGKIATIQINPLTGRADYTIETRAYLKGGE